jgi:arylsulfatase A-like enzyme
MHRLIRKFLPEYFNKKNMLTLSRQFNSALRKRFNVVLISIDALRQDHLGCYSYRRNTSPNIDGFTAKNIVFKNAFSASSWTVPSHMSLFTGRYPSKHSQIFYPSPGAGKKEFKMLTEILKENGYFNVGFHGGGYMSPLFGFNRGFHKYVSYGTRFEDNLDSCLRWLRRFNKYKVRFFLFLHGFNCHHPYKVPEDFDIFSANGITNNYVTGLMADGGVKKNASDLQAIIDKYDGEIRYSDHLIGKLITELERLSLIDHTVVLVTSDHGEQFQEHGITGHVYGLYDEIVRIPLIMHIPEMPKGKVIHEMVSMVDIMPTILDILNIKNNDKFNGKTLLNLIKDKKDIQREYIIAETGFLSHNQRKFYRAVRTNMNKLILDGENIPDAFYDLTLDPLEQKNVLHDNNYNIDKLICMLKQDDILNDIDLSSAGEQYPEINDDIKKQLKALGYF